MKQNWNQFLLAVKTTALKQQISKKGLRASGTGFRVPGAFPVT